MPIERKNIGIFGRVNVGKSLLMNRLTQQEMSIVDSTPGTTADVKQTVMELHELGPIKLFDTAGIDEKGELGEKKQKKSFSTLKECDLILLIIDPFRFDEDFAFEKQIKNLAEKRGKNLLLIFNIFKDKEKAYPSQTKKRFDEIVQELNYTSPYLTLDFLKQEVQKHALEFIHENFTPVKKKVDFFPFLTSKDIVFLNIPMDEETPEGRLLRPQALVQEKLLRRFIPTFAYRMNLTAARSLDPKVKEEEFSRFQKTLKLLNIQGNLKLVITDSQAMDIIHDWTLDSQVNITTFSVIMAHLTSHGRLNEFVKGIEAFKKLKKGDKVLIAEACNHNRIAEDIGTVQIPNKIHALFGKDAIHIDHAFGREFSSYDLNEYKLIIHCGGCMIDKQKLTSRLDDLIESNIPITNYGVLLSYFRSPEALKRVLAPFFIETR